jgi:2-keto-4-pentenoate hydratase/2-oxohepta-3-ene-1,7-dioic acid hydratase in catechol pathway
MVRDSRALARVKDVGDLLRLGPSALEDLRQLVDGASESEMRIVDIDGITWAAPVVAPSKMIAVGLNYKAHAEEGGEEVPESPLLFAKLPSALIGHRQPIVIPRTTHQLDYEGELAVVIGRRAKGVRASEAKRVIAGYTIINDITARDLQVAEPQWLRGKSLDTFAPLGPFFLTADQVEDVAELRIQTRVNGELRQDASCAEMIFSIKELIAFITESITLEPGDIIATGTPSGVGESFTPPRYLRPGDEVAVSITKLGTLRSPIIGI